MQQTWRGYELASPRRNRRFHHIVVEMVFWNRFVRIRTISRVRILPWSGSICRFLCAPPAQPAQHALVGRSSIRSYATCSLLREQRLHVAIALLSQAMTGDPVESCILYIVSFTKPSNSIETPNTRRGAITNEAGSRKLVVAR
jgi:hypothetical protein